MRQLVAPTEPFVIIERTRLAADVVAGSDVTLELENNDGMADNTFLAIGEMGSELCELQQINATVSGDTDVQVATLKFSHSKGEPVVVLRYNQRKFYGATSATGTFTELTSEGSPKDIQVDDPNGTLLEYAGDVYTYFKSTYYNSETAEETDVDDAEAVLGDESLRYATIYAIRKHAGLQGNAFYSDFRIETKRKQAESEINSVLYAKYVLPLTEVPPLIGQICELLAAGYIHFEEFGQEGEGVKWLGEARALLKAIRNGTQVLIGVDGQELTRLSASGRLEGTPNDGTEEGASFTIDQKF